MSTPLPPADRTAPSSKPGRGPRLLVALALLVAVLGFVVRWQHRDFLGPEIDRSSLHYWTQSVLDAPRSGLAIALAEPSELQTSPDTALYQLLGPAYLLPTRLANLSTVLVIGLWNQVFGSSLPSALLLGWLQTLVLSFGLALLTWRACAATDQGTRAAATLGVVLSVWAHPFLLLQATWVSWHSTALCFLVLAVIAVPSSAAAGAEAGAQLEIQSRRWTLRRRLLIGALLVLTFHASYLVPGLLLPCWALLACWPSLRARRWRALGRELLFWSAVAALCLPATLWVLLGPQTTASWLATWAGNPLDAAVSMAGKLLLASCGLVLPGVVAALRPPTARTTRAGAADAGLDLVRFLRPYLLANTILVVLILNAAPLDRLLLYLLPWNVLGAVSVAHWAQRANRHAGARAVLIALPLLGLIASTVPERWIAHSTGSGLASQRLAQRADQVAGALARAAREDFEDSTAAQEIAIRLDPAHLAFRNRDLAALISVRLGISRVALSNVERLLDALETDTLDEFLATRVAPPEIPDPLLLIADPETSTLLPRLRRQFAVERRELAGTDWFVLSLRRR